MQQRRHYTPPELPEQRFAEEASCLREQAKLLPNGAVREATIQRHEKPKPDPTYVIGCDHPASSPHGEKCLR